MEIKIIKGTYGQRTVNSVTKAVRVCPVHMGERVEVSDQEAARLVSLGVAAYLDEIPQDNPASDADSLGNGEKNGGAGKHPSDTDPLSTGLETPPAEDTPPEEDGDEIPEYSTDMKADQLRALMEQYDEIIVLRDGVLCERGTYEQLMAHKGYFYSLFTLAA